MLQAGICVTLYWLTHPFIQSLVLQAGICVTRYWLTHPFIQSLIHHLILSSIVHFHIHVCDIHCFVCGEINCRTPTSLSCDLSMSPLSCRCAGADRLHQKGEHQNLGGAYCGPTPRKVGSSARSDTIDCSAKQHCRMHVVTDIGGRPVLRITM